MQGFRANKPQNLALKKPKSSPELHFYVLFGFLSRHYLIKKNSDEANSWLIFLKDHIYVEELLTLEAEIVQKHVYVYDVEYNHSRLEVERHDLPRLPKHGQEMEKRKLWMILN